ncbi:MAG: hypothetical protein SV760_03725 [Halobacteria archaeon]|nr:hypothetical protein [Halobacteria archaeon]
MGGNVEREKMEALTRELREEFGEDARTVAVGNMTEEEYEVVYIRDEIDRLYPESKKEEIFKDVLLENISERRQEDLFEPLGDLKFTVRVFEAGVNVGAWRGDEALFVGLGPVEDEIPRVIEICRKHLKR